jgi:hypothetical protein
MPDTVDYSRADVSDNIRSFKGKEVAQRHAKAYAAMNDNQEHGLGEVFETTTWNGSENIPIWLAYDISATDEGWTISSYRWYTDPRKDA